MLLLVFYNRVAKFDVCMKNSSNDLCFDLFYVLYVPQIGMELPEIVRLQLRVDVKFKKIEIRILI